MAAKTRKIPAAKKVSDVPELPALAKDELMELRLLDMEAKLAMQEGRGFLMERQAYLAKIDPQGALNALDTKRTQCAERERASRLKYRDVLAAASKRLGIDLSVGCAIDPETGKIIQHEKKEK